MMFQEYRGTINIFQHGDELLFTCALADFLKAEPDYQAASTPIRIWSERHYLSDGEQEFEDPFFTQARFNLYTSQIEAYQHKLERLHYTAEISDRLDAEELTTRLNNDLEVKL